MNTPDHRQRGSDRQGWALLIVGGLIGLMLFWLSFTLFGFAFGGPVTLAAVGVLAAMGLGIGYLWHSGLVRWAWIALLAGPGLLALAGVATIVWFIASYALGLDGL